MIPPLPPPELPAHVYELSAAEQMPSPFSVDFSIRDSAKLDPPYFPDAAVSALHSVVLPSAKAIVEDIPRSPQKTDAQLVSGFYLSMKPCGIQT